MQLIELQKHFSKNNIQHAYRLPDWEHDVYQNPVNRRKFTIPINKNDIPDEYVQIGCRWLEIEGIHGESAQELIKLLKSKDID